MPRPETKPIALERGAWSGLPDSGYVTYSLFEKPRQYSEATLQGTHSHTHTHTPVWVIDTVVPDKSLQLHSKLALSHKSTWAISTVPVPIVPRGKCTRLCRLPHTHTHTQSVVGILVTGSSELTSAHLIGCLNAFKNEICARHCGATRS